MSDACKIKFIGCPKFYTGLFGRDFYSCFKERTRVTTKVTTTSNLQHPFKILNKPYTYLLL